MAWPTPDPGQSAPARILTLDFVRGVAVLGILLMNIQSFAMPGAAYLNPRAYGGAHGADLATWWIEGEFVDGMLRGVFSWLFGASLVVVVRRADGAGESAAAVHYRRMAWLFVFGLAHLLLVWDGDILAHYALVGSVAFLFRHKPTHALVAAGAMLIVGQIILDASVPLAIDTARTAIARGEAGAEMIRDLATWRDQFGVPPPASIAREIALHRGPWPALVASRVADVPGLVIGTLFSVGLETLAFMLFGMAALRSGMLAGRWTAAAYRRAALIGFGVAAPAMVLAATWEAARGFDLHTVAWAAMVLAAPWRPVMIAGWIGLLILLRRPGPLSARITAAGRMAFSNYLGTSLICAALFDGLGLFGRFSRAELLPVVVAVWALILLWSRPWLARYRYGPLEWLWRSLARGRRQPMRVT